MGAPGSLDLTRWALLAPIPTSRQVGADRTRCVLVALVQYADADGVAFPAAETLAEDIHGMNRRLVRYALGVLESASLIERVQHPRRSITWRVAGIPAGSVAGIPAPHVAGDVAGEVAGDVAGDVAGESAGTPATNRTEPELEPSPQPPEVSAADETPAPDRAGGHDHEPNARSSLARLIDERSLPFTVDELLADAYRLGAGDPWQGYLVVKRRTDEPLGGARDPRRVLRSRLAKSETTEPTATPRAQRAHEHEWLPPAEAYCLCGASRWEGTS